MLKSLVNRTIDSLVAKGCLERCEGKDKRTTFVRILPDNIGDYLAVHARSLALAHNMIEVIGKEDAETFVRIAEKIAKHENTAD